MLRHVIIGTTETMKRGKCTLESVISYCMEIG